MRRARKSQGFSLIECMVAATIGLLLLSAAFELFAISRGLFVLQHEISRAQEGGRTGVFLMAHTIRQAGFYRNPRLSPVSASALFPRAAPRITGVEGGDGADSLTVRYQGHEDGTVLDCLGNAVTCMGNPMCEANAVDNGLVVTNRFFLTPVEAESGLRSLSCTRSIPAARPPKSDTQPLVEGVADLQFLYGFDTDADGAANRYADARSVEAAEGWGQVVAIRMVLQVEGADIRGRRARLPARQRYEQTIWLRTPAATAGS